MFTENEIFKDDFVDDIWTKEWKNIPIPVCEAIEKIVYEFQSLTHKLNR